MVDTLYNGWTNYATWRIAQECFPSTDLWKNTDADFCKDLVEEHIEQQSSGIARDYALAFLADVNWHEIANSLEKE